MGSPVRQDAALETDHDLQKEVQNLLCDVHEEALHPSINWEIMTIPERQLHLALQKLMGINKRLASLLTVSALETGRVNAMVMWLTVVVMAQTIVVIIVAVLK